MGYVESAKDYCYMLCLDDRNREEGESLKECVIKCMDILINDTSNT